MPTSMNGNYTAVVLLSSIKAPIVAWVPSGTTMVRRAADLSHSRS